MRDIDLEQPDAPRALPGDCPQQRPVEMPTRREVEQAFLDENRDDFLRYCSGLQDIVEDYLAENLIAFQDFQWENWRRIGF